MSKIKWRGGAMLAPLPPVLVTCSDGEKQNAVTVGWTGITNTIPPKTYISLRKSRFSHEIISKTRVFVINLTTTDMVFATDYCGVRSGRDEDKLAKMNLETEILEDTGCPQLVKSPLSLECRVTDIIELGSHDMFLANIINVHVDDSLIDAKGALHIEKAGLLAYAHGKYFELGSMVGSFGFSVRKKPLNPKKRKNMPQNTKNSAKKPRRPRKKP